MLAGHDITPYSTLVILDPNVLNPYVLMDPSVASIVSPLVTSFSIALAMLISWQFFKSYRFSGFGYLLALPVGFAFMGVAFGFEYLSLTFSGDPLLYPAFFWIQLTLHSEALALIAVSYYYKNVGSKGQSDDGPNTRYGAIKTRDLLIAGLPMTMVIIPFIAPVSTIVSEPYFDYPELADLSFFMRIFSIAVIGYIFKSAVVSLVKSGNAVLLYIPAAFALLLLEQYSLIITYFDNSAIAFMGSIVSRIVALGLFVYVMHSVTSKRRMEIEARKKA